MSNDKVSPAAVKRVLEDTKGDRYRRDVEVARKEGFREGLAKGHKDILDWLQASYTGPNAPDRGSAEGEAILKMAKDAAMHFNPSVFNKGRR